MFRSTPPAGRPSPPPVVAAQFAIRAALMAATAFLLVPVAASARQQGEPLNDCGMPVLGETGQRLVYGPAELLGCARDKAAPAADLAPAGVTARWGYAGFGTAVGMSNIIIDGAEIYVGGSTFMYGPDEYWYALRYTRETRSYDQVFVSRRLSSLVRLGVGDVIGDARLEIVAAQGGGTVVLFDQVSRAELATLYVPVSGNVAGMTLHDLDGDGKAEVLLTTAPPTGNMLYVLSGSGTVLWQLWDGGGRDVVVGNMDGDPSLEIATTSGTVVDWNSRTVQWQRPQGFGIDVDTGDIDGDGKDELIAAQAWDFIWAFDVDTQLPKWSLPMFNTNAIWLGNVDADPALELLVGEAQWGEVLAFDALTLVQEWAIPNPEHGVTSMAIGDPDGNGTGDVLWGSGATSSGSDRLYVANLATHTIDWENVQLEGPFLPPQRGDVDGDGLPEIVTASTSSDSGYDSGRIVVLDGTTLRVRAISPPIVGNLAWTGLHDLRLRNVDADPQAEIVVAADRLYDGVIEIYDFAAPTTFTLRWTNTARPSGAPFYSVDVADVDADGALEVVGGVGKEHTGSLGTFVYVYSFPGGAEEWHTFALTTSWYPINGLAVLTQGGGVADIVAMVDGETLNFFSGTGQVQAIVPGAFRFLGPDASSPGRSFLAGTGAGEVRQYQRQGSGYGLTWSRSLGGPAVYGVSLLAGGAMAVAADGRLALYPERNTPLAWQSEDYGVKGMVTPGSGVHHRPFVGGSYAVVSLAPWLTLADVQPRSGPFYGGTLITVSGTSFDPAAQLYVGGRLALGTQVLGATLASGITPRLRPCSLNPVTVVNPDMSYEVLDDAFRARFAGCGPHEVAPTALADEPAPK